MTPVIILGIIVIFLYFFLRPEEEEEEEEEEKSLVNEKNVKKYFKFQKEIETIFSVVDEYLQKYQNTLNTYPLLVNPYVFMLAVRMCEQGRKGREFGVLAQGAIDTDLETQAEWTISTLIKDTIRWHKGELLKGKKSDYPTFIDYFADKWAPVGASNDPNNLNKNWLPNFLKYYNLFHP